MIIYLVLLLPAGSSDLPKAWRAAFISLLFGLASNGVYMCHCCYQQCGSLLHCLSTLTIAFAMAVYFCCTGLGVASTGRYPASCPMKPGLSSSAAFRHLHPRLSVLLNTVSDYTIFLLLRQQKVYLHPLPKWQADHTSHFEDVRHVLSPSETTLYAFLLL